MQGIIPYDANVVVGKYPSGRKKITRTARLCRTCNEIKPIDAFYYKSSYCKECGKHRVKPEFPVGVSQKRCATCGLIKQSVEFSKNIRSRDGLQSDCSNCGRGRCQEYKYKLKYGDDISGITKVCSKCNQEKPVYLFGANNRLSDGFHNICSDCRAIRRKRYTYSDRRSDPVSEKYCPACNTIKGASNFAPWDGSKVGLFTTCRDCTNARAKRYNKTLNGFLSHTCANIRTRSRSKGYEFDIDTDFLLSVLEKQRGRCFYTGIEFVIDYSGADERTTRIRDAMGGFSPSVDRVDCNRGYTRDNVVLACSVVNVMRNNLSYDDFVFMCRKIVSQYEERSIGHHTL